MTSSVHQCLTSIRYLTSPREYGACYIGDGTNDALALPAQMGYAPLTYGKLLWVNVIMDTLGALPLATKPPNNGLMNKPPVKRTKSFITKTME
ncbi:calcium-transporting ATPase 4, plasma membrane-type-like protein [Tanacetum coccineum]|uniref:Calcium-transporting ATPase 4, plasma membrane-type-like protein n=1 Tax=Tanacetum coccineum TaxID=301880 RepID=A0ABQ4Y2L9_9ASTR